MKKLSTEDKINFIEQGFLIIRNFFNADELQPILTDIEKVFSIATDDNYLNAFGTNLKQLEQAMFDTFKTDNQSFINAGKQVQHSLSLMRLATSEKIELLLKELNLTYPNLSVRPTIFFNSKNLDNNGRYWKLEAHQDWRSSQGSLDSVTIWLPYVDCDVQLGALQVIPGSHKQGLLPCSSVDYYSELDEDTYDEKAFIDVPMSKGDLLIFNSFLVHRSGTNSTQRIRWSSQFRFNNLNDKHFKTRGIPNAYIYRPSSELIDDKAPKANDISKYINSFKEELS
jgi:ectoine hydroxylase-related dioxygenase (phytanoyl-CoA dioxygenase family)